MGKVVKFTGSRLLGEELRRLRAGRTLDDVVELGKTKLVPSGFRYVGKGTLSDIENGKVLPNLESVFALSVLYQVPASRFVSLLLEESLLRDVAPPADADLREAYSRALRSARWTEALALAVHGVRSAQDSWAELRWRMNRATAMERLGMRTDAIAEMGACLESEQLPIGERYKVHRELGRMHMSSAHYQSAALHLDAAMRLMPPDAPTEIRLLLYESRIRLTVLHAAADKLTRSDEAVELAAALAREGRLLAVGDDRARLTFDLYAANIESLRGKHKDAKRRIIELIRECHDLGFLDREVEALQVLAGVESERDEESARKHLLRALDLASSANLVDHSFACCVALLAMARNREQRELFLRKCQRLYPLVSGATNVVLQYERLLLEVQ